MEQDIEIINTNMRNEKIKNFFINYKKQLIAILVIIILGLFGFFFYDDYKSDKKKELANKYNLAVIKYNSNQKENIETVFIDGKKTHTLRGENVTEDFKKIIHEYIKKKYKKKWKNYTSMGELGEYVGWNKW